MSPTDMPRRVSMVSLAPLLAASCVLGPAAAWCSESAQDAVVERYLQIVERNPRRGTAFDRVYAHHADRGTLDEWVDRYRSRIAGDPEDATAWMLVALIDDKRGRDAEAADALEQVERLDPRNPLAPYYLGQSLYRAGRLEQAAEAFERAVERKPAPADLLELLQTLGGLYQRMHRHERALAVWNRLESLFPDDLEVQEQIAQTLAHEGQYAEALRRYEALAESAAGDPSARVRYAVEAADVKRRLGRKQEALDDFARLLDALQPGSWPFQQVRGRIEEVFLSEGDRSGLADHYRQWLADHPDDVEAMTRLARILDALGRSEESRGWLERAVRLAPSRQDLRAALIDHLADRQRYSEAIAQCAELDALAPNDPDHLGRWGLLILQDPSRDEAGRRREAAEVWMRLVRARPDDPDAAVRVADLLRQAGMTDEPLALYKRAVEVAPDRPQYREYLGRFLHAVGRGDDALAAWRSMAEGDRRSTENLKRLSELLSRYGYVREAAEAAGRACELAPRDFETSLEYASRLADDRRYDEALARLDATDALALDDRQRDRALDRRIAVLLAAGRLAAEIDRLAARLQSGDGATAEGWRRLARYCEAASRIPEAMRAIREAVALDETSVATWQLAATIYERAGSLAEAAQAYRRLAEQDRSLRTHYLTELAGIEARLGRADEALAAGRELIAAAPGNPKHYQAFAELCFRLGRDDEAIEALRQSTRLAAEGIEPLLVLGDTLARQFKSAEAVEIYWQALPKSNDLDDKLTLVSRLAELHLRMGQFDRLLDRLDAARRGEENPREATFLIARAHLESHDLASARKELESLLGANALDARLLRELSALAERQGDLEAAADYQARLAQIDPDPRERQRLAQLYLEWGQPERAETVLAESLLDRGDPRRLLESLDDLLAYGRHDAALAVLDRAMRGHGDDWELLYRRGVVLASRDDSPGARRSFEQILALAIPDDTASAAAAPEASDAARQGAALARLQAVESIRRAAGLAPSDDSDRGRYTRPWMPPDFGQARIASIAWLLALARQEGAEPSLAARFAIDDAQPRDARALWDAFAYHLVRNEPDRASETARQLARAGDPQGRLVYLESLRWRRGPAGAASVAPLGDDELDHVVACYRDAVQSGSGPVGPAIVENLLVELERAGRRDEADAVYAEAIRSAQNAGEALALTGLATARNDVEGLRILLDALERADTWSAAQVDSASVLSRSLLPVMVALADRGRHDEAVGLFEGYLRAIQNEHLASRRTARLAADSPRFIEFLHERRESKPIQISYPTPNEIYDEGAIVLLRSLFEICREDERLPQLLSWFEDRVDRLGIAEAIMEDGVGGSPRSTSATRRRALLALSYLRAWSDDWEASARYLEQAVALGGRNTGLLLDLADLRLRRGDSRAALATFDEIEPLDQDTLIRRERAALRLAERVGDSDRARQAAERLFGVTLPVAEQLDLAGKMRELGMAEMADAVLRRAQRTSTPDNLGAILAELAGGNQTDRALEVARQILRQPRSRIDRSGRRDDPRARALQVLAAAGKLDELTAATEAQWRRSPNSIELMTDLVDCYLASKSPERTIPILESLCTGEIRGIAPNRLLALTERLEHYPGLRPWVVGVYEQAVRQEAGRGDRLESPVFLRLLSLYRMTGRAADARDLLLDEWNRRLAVPGTAESPIEAVALGTTVGEQLHEMGMPFEALALCRELGDRLAAEPPPGALAPLLARRVGASIERFQAGLDPEAILRNLSAFERPDSRPAGRPALDLAIFATSQEIAGTRIGSPVAGALKAVAIDPGLLASARRTVDRWRSTWPDDLSVAVAATILDMASGTAESKRQAVERLVALAEDDRPGQVGLWLVARDCLRDDDLRPFGRKLAGRALEAAWHEADRRVPIAMLREQGQLALERGDREAAEAAWRELLAALLGCGPDRSQPAAGRAVSPETFAEAVALARLCLARGLTELSLECVRESLAGGEPRPDTLPLPTTWLVDGSMSSGATFVAGSIRLDRNAAARPVVVSSGPFLPASGVNRPDEPPSVEEAIAEMCDLWRRSGIAPEAIYATLRGVVFPERSPGEILLYPRRLSESNWTEPHSVGRRMVEAAIASGQIDDLRRHIAVRHASPLAQLPARVLALQLAVACRDAQRAGEAMAWLSARLKDDPAYATARLACHGLIPALGEPATSEAAAPVFERAAANLAALSGDRLAASLRMALTTTAFERGDVDEAVRQLYAYRAANGNTLVRANSSRVEKMRIMEAGLALARAGRVGDALTVLGDFVSRPHVFGRGQSPSLLVAPILRWMESMPDAEQYHLLKAWLLPNEEPRRVLQLAYFTPTQSPPAVFLGFDPPDGTDDGVVSFTELLIRAASRAGKLGELEAELQWAADQRFEGAEQVLVLVRIALGKRDAARPHVDAVLADLTHYLATEPGHRRLVQWHHYLMARACLRDDGLREVGEELARALLDQSQRLRDFAFQTHLARDLHTLRPSSEADPPGPDDGPGLAWWQPAGHQRASTNERGPTPAWWTVRDGAIHHLCGPEQSFLYFRYPLTGTFEIAVEGYSGNFADAAAAYGGLGFEALNPTEKPRVWSVGEHDGLACERVAFQTDRYNALSIEVRPEAVRYLANGELVYEDPDPSPASPWFALVARGDRTTSWRNLQITGRPEIPREVRLCEADRLDGWTALHFDTFGFHGGHLPKRLSATEVASPDAARSVSRARAYEWSARDGVILGAPEQSELPGPVQSWLAYHRPLGEGETVSYEFFYEPGRSAVHPAVDRVAFLIEPEGVRLHWITDDRREPAGGLPADNGLLLAEAQRGPRPLPLEPGQWNAMQVSLTGGAVILRVGGVEICRYVLEPANRRLFGLFHDRGRTTARVRNVVLRGDWPASLPAELGMAGGQEWGAFAQPAE